MRNVLEQLPGGARVLVIRLRSLGDCVLTTPALDILKQARPDLKLAVVVENRFAPVFEGNPDIDAILSPGLKTVSRWRPDLCLNLHGGTRSMLLMAAARPRFRAGFRHHWGSSLYNVRIPAAQEILGVDRVVHTAEHLASAIFSLGAPVREIPRARLFAEPLLPEPAPATPHAIVHPFASAPDKIWPAERFVSIAEHLRRTGVEPIIVAGSEDDIRPFRIFRVVSRLTELKSLLKEANLFLGNDSGPAHMAAAFRVPVVVLFGPSSNPLIWSPWRTKCAVLVETDGIEKIEASRVLKSIEQVLETSGVRA